MWQYVQLSELVRFWDTIACFWNVKQPANQQTFPTQQQHSCYRPLCSCRESLIYTPYFRIVRNYQELSMLFVILSTYYVSYKLVQSSLASLFYNSDEGQVEWNQGMETGYWNLLSAPQPPALYVSSIRTAVLSAHIDIHWSWELNPQRLWIGWR